jgi:dimethylhistidine N-methyltransferase
VQYYLMQRPRQLPSRYLYDDLGSALFEAICCLPWYPITRAEERLLAAHGADVFRRVAPMTIVELGSGSGEKLRMFLDAADVDSGSLTVHLVDLSSAALDQSTRTLAPLEYVRVITHEATYETGLSDAARTFAPTDRVLVLFLGSNIGNFDPPACEALLRGIRRELRPGDALLLGADLVKPARDLHLAYDDPLGVTAAFNRNLLVRVNRELGGDFAIDRFAHRAVWNDVASRVEMHLVAQSDMEVQVASAGLGFTMAAGEPIWTESSYKYRADEIVALLGTAGLRATGQWLDARDRFALTLAEAV